MIIYCILYFFSSQVNANSVPNRDTILCLERCSYEHRFFISETGVNNMSKTKKSYVKPELTIIPPDSPKHKEILQHLERESRGQRFKITHPPPYSSDEKI